MGWSPRLEGSYAYEGCSHPRYFHKNQRFQEKRWKVAVMVGESGPWLPLQPATLSKVPKHSWWHLVTFAQREYLLTHFATFTIQQNFHQWVTCRVPNINQNTFKWPYRTSTHLPGVTSGWLMEQKMRKSSIHAHLQVRVVQSYTSGLIVK